MYYQVYKLYYSGQNGCNEIVLYTFTDFKQAVDKYNSLGTDHCYNCCTYQDDVNNIEYQKDNEDKVFIFDTKEVGVEPFETSWWCSCKEYRVALEQSYSQANGNEYIRIQI